MTMIKCDACAAVFTPEQTTKVLDPGVEWIFIRCPRCGAEYTVTVTDEQLRAMVNELKTMRNRKTYDFLRKQIRAREVELREKYEYKMRRR